MIECIFNCIKDAIKKIKRFIIMKRLYHKSDEIARERKELISKKYQEGITFREEKRIKYLERQLDKIEDAKMGKYLDHLESMIVSRERIVKDIEVEVERIGAILETNLSMPIDAGKCALENVDSLLNKYEKEEDED